MTLARFDPPGNLDDLQAAEELDAWSDLISSFFDARIGFLRSHHRGLNEVQFVNPTKAEPAGASVTADIRWEGFPRAILNKHDPDDDGKYVEAEQLLQDEDGTKFRPQDEYLEWHTERDGDGKVTRVTFTCEGPEYWSALAQLRRERVLELYQEHVSPDVAESDLFPDGGKYDRNNVWNTERGAMHLTHPSNALSAEVFLAADATILRERGGKPVTEYADLIDCARYGDANRFSDPKIGGDVNTLAQKGYRLTLQNPVGLYIDGLDATGIEHADGSPAGDFFKPVRGKGGLIVRAVYEVPDGKVGDLRIGGSEIRWGSQLAERITMKLTGVAYTENPVQNPAFGCVPRGAPAVAASVSPHATRA
jgi:hypothetical protein